MRYSIKLISLLLTILFFTVFIVGTKPGLSQISPTYTKMSVGERAEYKKIKKFVLEGNEENLLLIKMKYSQDFYLHVFDMLINEDPECFGYSGVYYKLIDKNTMEIRRQAQLTGAEQAACLADAKQKIACIIEETKNLSDESAFVTYFQYIFENITYLNEGPYVQSAFGCMYTGTGNCQGMSKLLRYLCTAHGIPCTLEKGTFDGMPHMWNTVELSNTQYYVDVTNYSVHGQVLFKELPSAYVPME